MWNTSLYVYIGVVLVNLGEIYFESIISLLHVLYRAIGLSILRDELEISRFYVLFGKGLF